MKKAIEVFVLAIGLMLFFISLTLLGRPGASQGVEAMPQKYSLSLSPINNGLNRLSLNPGLVAAFTAAPSAEDSNTPDKHGPKDDDEKHNFQRDISKKDDGHQLQNFSKKGSALTARED